MKHILVSVLLMNVFNINCKDIISYNLNGGRLGNCIVTYTKAFYVAWKYDMNLKYVPFEHSNLMRLHYRPQLYPMESRRRIFLRSEGQLKSKLNESVFLVSDYYLELDGVSPLFRSKTFDDKTEFLYEKAIAQPEFHEKIKDALTPISSFKIAPLSNNCITIAVHVRKGSGTDLPLRSEQQYTLSPGSKPTIRKGFCSDECWPTLFVPDQYYIDQIRKLSDLLGDPPLYVHIFTDSKDPQKILDIYSNVLSKGNIIFGYNVTEVNPIHDMWNMARFDCLIRSSSTFGWAAQLIGNHKVIIRPLHATWYDNILHVDEIELVIPDKTNCAVCKYNFFHLDNQVKNLIRNALVQA